MGRLNEVVVKMRTVRVFFEISPTITTVGRIGC